MSGSLAPDYAALLAGLARALEESGFPFMLIGGQAVLLHGNPRLTDDIDVALAADPRRVPDLLVVFAVLGLRALPEDPFRFAEETSVLPAQEARSGIRVDFVFSTTPYERQAIERAVRVDLAGVPVPFAAAEDLILHKLFAGRPRDLEDARGVVRRKGGELDWSYLETWGAEFAAVPGRESLLAQLAALRNESPG